MPGWPNFQDRQITLHAAGGFSNLEQFHMLDACGPYRLLDLNKEPGVDALELKLRQQPEAVEHDCLRLLDSYWQGLRIKQPGAASPERFRQVRDAAVGSGTTRFRH